MSAVIAGLDEDDLGEALEAEGVPVVHVDGIANRPALEEAGICEATLFVLTDASQATSIPVARDLNPDLRIVVYADDSLPEFARPGADLILDPDALRPEIVAEELAGV